MSYHLARKYGKAVNTKWCVLWCVRLFKYMYYKANVMSHSNMCWTCIAVIHSGSALISDYYSMQYKDSTRWETDKMINM